jgi:hypothetical protein
VGRLLALAIAALTIAPAFADEKKAELLSFAPSGGLSYPFIASIGAGALLSLGKPDPDNVFPSRPALRADVEVGLGGGLIAAGLYVPAGAFALNVKAASLRTWLLAWNQESDQTYDGAIIELVALGHVPGKVGLGRFRERASGARERDKLTYLFVGVGF